jgi:hypothetical protein
MWGKLQLAQPGDSPALACGPPEAMKLSPAMFFNRPIFENNWHSA